MAKQPRILVTSEHSVSAYHMNYVPVYLLDKAYAHAVSAAGAVPVAPLGPGMEQEYSEIADGLLLTGGQHIHPGRYHTPFDYPDTAGKTNYYRDAMEFDLFHAFRDKGKPIMGIGRGMQLINVALGGSLFQQLDQLYGLNYANGKMHSVSVEPDSVLQRLFGDELKVCLEHNQAVSVLGKGLRTTSHTREGIIESLEHSDKPIFGVQFQVERMNGGSAEFTDMDRMFQYFVQLM